MFEKLIQLKTSSVSFATVSSKWQLSTGATVPQNLTTHAGFGRILYRPAVDEGTEHVWPWSPGRLAFSLLYKRGFLSSSVLSPVRSRKPTGPVG